MDASTAPNQIRLVSDEYHLEGFRKVGPERWLWVSGQGDHDATRYRYFACSIWFDAAGTVVDHDIEHYATEPTGTTARDVTLSREVFGRHYQGLAGGEMSDLWIDLFAIPAYDTVFELRPRFVTSTRADHWRVEFMPGNTLSFYPPWQEGLYDT
ncbi:MAG: hypothetical protein AAF409_12335 [Pseudomonadota bacterium]